MDSNELKGEFDRVIWPRKGDAEGTWVIASLSDGTVIKGPAKASTFIRDVEYKFNGKWVTAKGYEKSFQFTNYALFEPVTDDAIKAYLDR